MPMRYANEADVLDQLRLEDTSDEYDRLVRLENGLCDLFDHKIGRSFGVAPVAEMRTIGVYHGGVNIDNYWGIPLSYTSWFGHSPRLVLDVPLRSLTGIETGGTWNGTGWDDGTALAADEYRLTNGTNQGYYAIDLISGTWSGVVRITGVWGDQDTQAVPDDVREALTFLTVHEWHQSNGSTAGLIGPDGLTVPTRNPWAFERVKTAIDRHALVQVMV